jgi:AcrR family transcriptional regulator
MAQRQSPGRGGRPPRLSRDDVVAAARRVAARDGVDVLTMRRVAQEAGTTAMALYHYVRNREELLLLLLDHYAAGITSSPERADPRTQIIDAATAMHAALAAEPWVAEVLSSDRLLSRAALWYPERIIDGLVRAGRTPVAALRGYRAIWYYTVGEILIRAHAARSREAGPTVRDQVLADLEPTEFPRLAGLSPRWAEVAGQDHFRSGLTALVHGLLQPESDRPNPP